MLEDSKQLVILDMFHLPFQEVVGLVGLYDMIWRFPFCHGGTPTHTVVMTMTQYWWIGDPPFQETPFLEPNWDKCLILGSSSETTLTWKTRADTGKNCHSSALFLSLRFDSDWHVFHVSTVEYWRLNLGTRINAPNWRVSSFTLIVHCSILKLSRLAATQHGNRAATEGRESGSGGKSWTPSAGMTMKIRRNNRNCLVLWNMFYDFPYIESNHPNWRTPSFFRGVGQPPTKKWWCFSW